MPHIIVCASLMHADWTHIDPCCPCLPHEALTIRAVNVRTACTLHIA